MYIRPSHRARDPRDVVNVIRTAMFATLVSRDAESVIASHLPFVFEPALGEHGTLFAHMARANPHSAVISRGEESLVVFVGPHAYISPSWYVDRATAPTWDYAAVHCYGMPVIHSAEEGEVNLRRLIAVVEEGGERPWSIDELERPEVEAMIGNIVSFEIRVSRMEGKFKLNQGEKNERTRAAIERLQAAGHAELAAYLRRYNDLE